MFAHVQGLAIKGLEASCLPAGETVDACHQRTLRLRKKSKNEKLFVYHDVQQFLPLQFKGVSCVCSLVRGATPLLVCCLSGFERR